MRENSIYCVSAWYLLPGMSWGSGSCITEQSLAVGWRSEIVVNIAEVLPNP